MFKTTIDGKFLGNRQYTVTQVVNESREVIYQVDYRVTRNGNLYGPTNRLKSDGITITFESGLICRGFGSLDSAHRAIEQHARKPYIWKQAA